MVAITLLLIGTLGADSSVNVEQLATNYFFENIWKEKYTRYNSIEFNYQTQTDIYTGHILGCNEWTKEEKGIVSDVRPTELVKLTVEQSEVRVRKQRKSKQIKLIIGSKIKLADWYIVQVDVYKPLEFVDHYFLKIDKNGNVIDRCDTNEII